MENYLKDAASTRDKILFTTLKLIGKEGFQNITIKKIADLAEVNIAAVNYHFGSKTNVINEAMQVLNVKLVKCFEVLDQKHIPPVERLRSFLLSYMERALEYPDVFRSFIYSAINNSLDDGNYIVFLKKEGFEKIRNTINEVGLVLDKDELVIKLVQMVGSLELPILLGEHMEQMSGMDFNSNEIRVKYVELALKSLLTE